MSLQGRACKGVPARVLSSPNDSDFYFCLSVSLRLIPLCRWYFDAGEFRMPVSGCTHLNTTGSAVQWSAYRFHEMDPINFRDGLVFQWRNGDTVDASGHKCNMLSGFAGA